MKWNKIENGLPMEFEEVLFFDGTLFWVGFLQLCMRENKKVNVWWGSNPNKNALGHLPFLVATEPLFWTHLLQPERLSPEASKEDAIV